VRKLDTKKILRLVSFRLKDVLLLLFYAAQRWAGDSPAADELAVNPTWRVTHE
jgi:hypothetical protein